jgi:predicted acyltransferase
MATVSSASPRPARPSGAAPAAGSGRLMSLDALRGFDMFWIIGGTGLVLSFARLLGFQEETIEGLRDQFEHVTWNGFHFIDLIFPLFVFMVGVAMPLSFGKHFARGESRGRLYWRICRRTVLLILLGIICNNGLLRIPLAEHRFGSVLGRIGLCYFFASLITLHSSVRGRLLWIAGLLLGYWAALMWIPVPNFGPGNLAPGATLADYLDRTLLPGRLYVGVRDPEGLLSTVPAIATTLIGVLAGGWLRDSRRNGHVKAAALLLAGLACLALGYLWNQSFPINKNLWSSSFVLWTGGLSLMLLGLFYLVIDVWGWDMWAFFFAVIGVNAITIYVGQQWIDFDAVGRLFFGHAPLPQALLHNAGLAAKWLALYLLFRQRIFLRL